MTFRCLRRKLRLRRKRGLRLEVSTSEPLEARLMLTGATDLSLPADGIAIESLTSEQSAPIRDGASNLFFGRDSIQSDERELPHESFGGPSAVDAARERSAHPALEESHHAIRSGDWRPEWDLSADDQLDDNDLRLFAEQALQTTVGDANLDGQFDSSDLVQIFQRGEYDDGVEGNSTWADGDWNADGEFDSEDIVFAFQVGSYADSGTRVEFPRLRSEEGADERIRENEQRADRPVLSRDRRLRGTELWGLPVSVLDLEFKPQYICFEDFTLPDCVLGVVENGPGDIHAFFA